MKSLFPRLSVIVTTALACTCAAVFPYVAQSQPAFTLKNLSKWQTVTNKEAGVSVLMPPGAEVTPKAQTDPATGAKVVMLMASSVTNSSKYMIGVFRVNDVALEQLRKKYKEGQSPLEMLYQTTIKPDIDQMIKDAQKDPTLGTISRKPVTWNGLQGDEVITKANIEKSDKLGENGLLRLRILKNQDSLLIVGAAEKKQSPEGEQRIERFFQSLTLLPEFSAKF